MPSASASTGSDTHAVATPPPRLVLLPRESRADARPEGVPRRYRLARLEATKESRAERFAHLKRGYD